MIRRRYNPFEDECERDFSSKYYRCLYDVRVIQRGVFSPTSFSLSRLLMRTIDATLSFAFFFSVCHLSLILARLLSATPAAFTSVTRPFFFCNAVSMLRRQDSIVPSKPLQIIATSSEESWAQARFGLVVGIVAIMYKS